MAGLDPSVAKDGNPDTSPASLLEGAEAEAGELTRLLDAIPGAWDQAELGRIQGAAGQTTPLDQL
jgi:hypothetical protein